MGATNHGRATVALVMAAGGVVWAGPPDGEEELGSAPILGHLYVDARTGEVTAMPAGAPRLSDLFWQNDDRVGACYFFSGVDRPTRDTTLGRVKFGATVVSWGDVPAQSVVDGFEIAFATNLVGCEGRPPAGFGVRIGFIERYDGGILPGGPVTGAGGAGPTYEVAAFEIFGFSAAEPICEIPFTQYGGWYVTVDLEGSGHEFKLGDVAAGLGGDTDDDGQQDFGYSYTFIQGQAGLKGICGPYIVLPASVGGHGSATTGSTFYEWFNNLSGPGAPYSDYVGGFDFGGALCPSGPPSATWYINLYGTAGTACAVVDYTADGLVDFVDYLEFLNRYDALDVSADLNGDGVVDFADYLEFLNLFDACA